MVLPLLRITQGRTGVGVGEGGAVGEALCGRGQDLRGREKVVCDQDETRNNHLVFSS